MKARAKFVKAGAMKFVGHLDIMRYFQKAFRRSGIDIAYSQGYSPHQILSFAAPLGVGLTSDGEYLDMELVSSKSSAEMLDIMNAQMTEGIQLLSLKCLPENSKNAMSIVAAADYKISVKDGYQVCEEFTAKITEFISRNEILITKKTKRSEKEVDIRPSIYHYEYTDKAFGEKIGKEIEVSVADLYENGNVVYLQLATGSVNNLKPELVMEAFCAYIQVEYLEFAFQVHRLEVYADEASPTEAEAGIRKLISLDNIGTNID